MTIEVRPDLVTLARESRGLTQTALAQISGVKQPTISRLEAGFRDLEPAQFDALAEALRFPRDFFTQTDRFYVGGSCFKYRKLKSVGLKTIKQVEAECAVLGLRVARLLRGDVDVSPERSFQHIHVGPRGDFGRPRDAADWVRADWGLPLGPVGSVTEVIENAGGLIFICDFGTPKITAISQWFPPKPPMFFVNSDLPGDRLRLSLAHEMGHVFMHHMPAADAEQEAFEFASEFLMPMREIIPALRGQLDMSKLATLKMQWRTSIAALARWAWAVGAIDERKYVNLNIEISRNGWKRREPVDLPIERPTLLPRILEHYRSVLGFSDADLRVALLINDEDDFRAFLRAATGEAPPNLRML